MKRTDITGCKYIRIKDEMDHSAEGHPFSCYEVDVFKEPIVSAGDA